MAKLRIGLPLWLDLPLGHQPRTFPRQRGHLDVDVAIVGGGITGCSAAYLFAKAGLRVALLESHHIGRGSTAASTALLMQEPDTDLVELAERYGDQRARQIWRISREATRELASTLRRLKISCGLRQGVSIYYTRSKESVAALRRELAMRQRAGLGGRWLSANQLSGMGIDARGAILARGNAQVDPYRACRGLADAAARGGARIFEGSPVRRVQRDGSSAIVTTREGTVRAAWALIATGYATREFKPLLSRFKMMTTYVIATSPLSASLRRHLPAGAAMLWDTERPYHYSRQTPDHRLIFGGADLPLRGPRARKRLVTSQTDLLLAELLSVSPALADVKAEYAWEGLFATTPDGLPYIGTHRRYPRHLFALGYGGNGMTFGFLAARMLLRRVLDGPSDEDELFGFGRMR